jgi:hypothetical protein
MKYSIFLARGFSILWRKPARATNRTHYKPQWNVKFVNLGKTIYSNVKVCCGMESTYVLDLQEEQFCLKRKVSVLFSQP